MLRSVGLFHVATTIFYKFSEVLGRDQKIEQMKERQRLNAFDFLGPAKNRGEFVPEIGQSELILRW